MKARRLIEQEDIEKSEILDLVRSTRVKMAIIFTADLTSGYTIKANLSKVGLREEVAGYCREHWKDEMGQEPDENEDVLWAYFNWMSVHRQFEEWVDWMEADMRGPTRKTVWIALIRERHADQEYANTVLAGYNQENLRDQVADWIRKWHWNDQEDHGHGPPPDDRDELIYQFFAPGHTWLDITEVELKP